MKGVMPGLIHRRAFLGGAAGAALAAAAGKNTYVYKTAAGVDIKADVHRDSSGSVHPVVVWIHGGALINGHREAISAPVREWALNSGYVLVSIDYRLAPETQLPAIIRDVEDAFAWIRKDGPRLFRADASKIAVAGGSAGGYLTLTAGFRVKPRPAALLSLWGYGDLIGDWYSKPSPHERHHKIKMSSEEAYRQVSGPAVADSRDRKGDGGAFYQHCRQLGTWPRAVSGWDPVQEAAKFYPHMPVKNVTKGYPPTVLIHGTADTDVPHEQSIMMSREFARRGVAHAMISIPGAEHGLAGGDPKLVDAAYRQAFAFVNRLLK
jgi:acetyl esterase/lipase